MGSARTFTETAGILGNALDNNCWEHTFCRTVHEPVFLPSQKHDEGAQDLVEHGDVDVVGAELGVPAHHGDELRPGEDDGDGCRVPLGAHVAAVAAGEQQETGQADQADLKEVLEAEEVSGRGD